MVREVRLERAAGPMYQQVRRDILARIRRGEFGPGDHLPSESRVCKEYGVSATTARRAFLELVKEGVILRKAGVGTMVASRVRRARLAFVSVDYEKDVWRHVPAAVGALIGGSGEYAWQRDATFSTVGVEEERAEAHLRALVEEGSVDGVLLRTANDVREEYLEVLEGAGIPYVVVKRHIPGREMNCVISDDEQGASMAVAHLLGLGHRRIGFVCAKPSITISRERLAGYRRALEEAEVAFDERLVRQQPHFTMEAGYRAARALLGRSEPPTALFVASDTMALGAYQAVWDLGLGIPGDVALVGYDDIAPAGVLQPPLTTVRTSYYDFGSMAARLLLDLIEGTETAPQRRVIRPELILRRSTDANLDTDARRTLAPTARERSASAARAEEPPIGRLSGRVVAIFSEDEEMRRLLLRACEAGDALAETAELSVERVLSRYGRLDCAVCGVGSDLRRDPELALEFGRTAARAMAAGRGGGCVVFVARAETKASGVALEAELGYLSRTLAAEREEYGPGAVGLLISDDATDVSGPLALLASEEAVALSGGVLFAGQTIHDPELSA